MKRNSNPSFDSLRFDFTLLLVAWLCVLGGSALAGTGAIDTAAQTINLSVLFSYPETDDNLESATVTPDWREVFDEASARLWQATNGQLKIGKVTVYRRAFNKKDDADVWIVAGSGTAYANGLGKLGVPGFRMTLYETKHRSLNATYRGSVSLVHEMGHHVFSLNDQYLGAFVPLAKKDTWVDADLSAFQESVFVNSVSATDAVASLMDAGGGVNNTRTEFDTAGNTNKGVVDGNKFWMNKHFVKTKESCWETMGKFKWGGVTVFPVVPTGNSPTDVPPGATAVTWEVVPTLSRLVVCIDRSGSMSSENRMELAKLGATILTNLTEERHEVTLYAGTPDEEKVIFEGDRLAVVDFDDDVTTTFPLTEVDAAGTAKTQARAAIDGLFPDGSTAIGDGAQRSLDLITAAGAKVTQEAIVLLSDGQTNTGSSPATAAANARARGAKIFSIALGSGADAATLSSMAATTGGKFYQATNGLGLLDIYTRIYGELRGGGLVDAIGSLVSEKTTEQQVVKVDEFTEEVTFSLASPDSGFGLEVTSPRGKTYKTSVPADGVLFETSPQETHFRVTNPAPGNWRLTVRSPQTSSGATYQYNLITNSSNATVSAAASTDKPSYTFPEPVKIQCQVTAGDPVAGATVTADVTGPNGILGKLTLYDDGAALHGDAEAADGTYTGLYSAFPASGTYNIEVKVVNVNGTAVTGESEPAPGTGAIKPKKIAPFARNSSTTVVVSGVPVVDQQWLRVDALTLAKNARNPNTSALSARLTLNAPQEAFQPGVEGFTLRLDSSVLISVPAGSILPTRTRGVFTIKNEGLGLRGAIKTAIGGSSRHEIVLTAKSLASGSFDFNTTTSARLIFGTFDQTVVLSNTTNAATTRIAYNSQKNFSQTRVLYLDGLAATVTSGQTGRDTLRLVASFEGSAPGYDPATGALVIDVGDFQIPVPAGSLVLNRARTKALGTITLGGGKLNIAVDLAKQVLTVNGTKLNAGALKQTSVIGLQLGSFDEANIVTFKATSKKGAITFGF